MIATQWLEIFVSYSLQVLIVVSVCKLLERAVARPSDRCAIWNMGFLSVLILGCAALSLPRLHLIQPWSRLEPETLLKVSAAQTVIAQFLLVVWCIGASVSIIQWVLQGNLLRRTLRRCERLAADEVRHLVGLSKMQCSDRDLPSVLISDEADGPFCWQLHEPTVVLPRFLLDGSRDDLRHVLMHELEQLKTNHPFQVFWQRLAHVVCWFHPAVWNAGSHASLMREFTCDEAAANHGANSAAYLRTLLHIAERFEQKRNHSAIGFVKKPSEIALRARFLVDLAKDPQRSDRRRRLSRKAAACIVIGVTCLLYLAWIPVDSLASPRSAWSPWPSWTAQSLHCFGWNLRDYEQYDRRVQTYEIAHHNGHPSVLSQPPLVRNAADN